MTVRERLDEITRQPLRPVVEVLKRQATLGRERHQAAARVVGIDLGTDEPFALQPSQQPAHVAGVEAGAVAQLTHRDAVATELEEETGRPDRSP